MKHRLWILTAIMILLLAAACSPAAPAEAPAQATSVATDIPAEPAPTEGVEPTAGSPTEATTVVEDPTVAPTDAPVVEEEPPAVTCEVAPQLRATDPSGVQLASGKVQLVEFFAFW